MKKNGKSEKVYIPAYLLMAVTGLILLILGVALGSKLENGLLMGALTGAGVVILGNGAWKVIALASIKDNEEDKETRILVENAKIVKMKAAWMSGRFTLAAMGIGAITLGIAEQFVGAFFLIVLMVLQIVVNLIFTIHYKRQ